MNTTKTHGRTVRALTAGGLGAVVLLAPVAAHASPSAAGGTTKNTTLAGGKTGTIKICQHGGGDARLRVYAEGRTGRSAELAQGRCVQWSGIKKGAYEIGYDSIGGNCKVGEYEEPYSINRVTVHRPGSLRAHYYLPVVTSVEGGQTTAVGVYTSSNC